MKFHVELQSRKLIKPCTPTPSHLRSYKISVIDELNPSMFVPRIIYYQHNDVIDDINLEESLARTLPLFYPLAGRYIKEKHLVDCNDDGADYSRAQVLDCDLLTLIASDIEPDQLNDLLPLEVGAADEPTDPMLAVRVTRFRCGGLAIGVCAAHRILDAGSVSIFLTAWAHAAAGATEPVIRPDFESPSLFPGENLAPLDLGLSRTRDGTIVCKRFVFDRDAISTLRDRASPDWRSNSRPPSRVVVVSAVLTQALGRTAGESRKSSIMIAQAINVRERSVPPVAKHACGSWALNSFLEYTTDDDFQGLVRKMREANIRGVEDCARILSDREFGRHVLVGRYFDAYEKEPTLDFKILWVTDFGKFGDYQLDFGFGTPVWVSMAAMPLKDIFVLMSNKEDDGIEAWVYLHESQMQSFEQDQDVRMLTAATTATATPPPPPPHHHLHE